MNAQHGGPSLPTWKRLNGLLARLVLGLSVAQTATVLGQDPSVESPPTESEAAPERSDPEPGQEAPPIDDQLIPTSAQGVRAPVTEAEKILSLRRSIEASQQELERLAKEIDDPESEHARAEAEFRRLDEQDQELQEELETAREAEQTERVEELELELERLSKFRELARERFDLALERRRAMLAKLDTLKEVIERDTRTLNMLTGDEVPEPELDPEPAPIPPAPEVPPAPAEDPAPVTPLPLPLLPNGLPTPDDPAPAEAPPPEFTEEEIEAEREAALKARSLEEITERLQWLEERQAILRQQIAHEEAMLRSSRQLTDNASQARDLLSEEFLRRSIEQADPDELRALRRQVQDAERRARAARMEVRSTTDRLEELRKQESLLLQLRAERLQEVEQRKAELAAAQARLERLRNPFAPENLLRWVTDKGPSILAVIIGALVLKWLVLISGRRAVVYITNRHEHGSQLEREDRAKTLVGVFQSTASLIIIVGGVFMIMEVVGVPIAPLLGGAAVIGLAVAFGAQSLIKDFFTGFVILLENQYKLNDVAIINGTGGLVEQISLRMTALRDLEGNLHFFPNGEITSVTNMTHTWSRALFDIPVAYKENVDRVMDVLIELGKELRQDPKFKSLILEDPTMLGVDDFADSAVLIKFFIKTRPLQQWTVKRELLRRIKNRFDELGIEIPFPHRTVYHRAADGQPFEQLAARAGLGNGSHGMSD